MNHRTDPVSQVWFGEWNPRVVVQSWTAAIWADWLTQWNMRSYGPITTRLLLLLGFKLGRHKVKPPGRCTGWPRHSELVLMVTGKELSGSLSHPAIPSENFTGRIKWDLVGQSAPLGSTMGAREPSRGFVLNAVARASSYTVQGPFSKGIKADGEGKKKSLWHSERPWPFACNSSGDV